MGFSLSIKSQWAVHQRNLTRVTPSAQPSRKPWADTYRMVRSGRNLGFGVHSPALPSHRWMTGCNSVGLEKTTEWTIDQAYQAQHFKSEINVHIFSPGISTQNG
jgi:hypothetical protein